MSEKWYEKSGENGETVISSRIRFARNISNLPFPCRMSVSDKHKVVNMVKNAVLQGNSALSERFKFIDMENISQEEAISLVERHIVSPEFISDREGRGLLLLDDESISIMINEEDHIRLQVMKEGFSLDEVYDICDKIDTMLDENLKFAFDEKLGYLTQCLTNLGTGMRASVMLHLPALQDRKAIGRISQNLSKLGLTIRGTYGEGTEPKGAMYQLSNQVTLGISEKVAINNLKNIAVQLINQEQELREKIVTEPEVIDIIYRSKGILKNAYLISNDESIKLLSNIRLGVSLGMIKDISLDLINRLIVELQPATLMESQNKNMSSQERDICRAKLLKEKLENCK